MSTDADQDGVFDPLIPHVIVNDDKATCQHRPGKFLGHCMSPNYERYECALCREELTVRVNR